MLSILFAFIIRWIEFILYPTPTQYVSTQYDETVQCVKLPSGRPVAYTIFYRGKWLNVIPAREPIILFYHGNGMSLQDCKDVVWCNHFFNHIDAVIVFVEYVNYARGIDSILKYATQTEDLLEEAVEFCDWMHNNHPDNPLFLMGHSLGTGIAIHVASTPLLVAVIKGVILVSPYLSIISVVNHTLATWLPFIDLLCSYKRVADVCCPMISFVGTEDGLIAPWHSKMLFQLQKRSNCTVDLENAGHNTTLIPRHFPTIITYMNSLIDQNIFN